MSSPNPESQTEFAHRQPTGQSPSPPKDTLLGRVISQRYRIERLLGVGGMGSVYQAEHVHMKKAVALKVLHKEMTHVPEAVARFEREAIAAARIEHPNIVAAKDFGRLDDGAFYLALEFVEGKSLREELERCKVLPTDRAIHVARQIAEALRAAHAESIVHRDLKPDNIMLVSQGDQEDFVKVLDFGIAKVPREATGDTKLTQIGAVFGTPDYMSPEQAKGESVGPGSDLYTLGIMLYEMLSGDTPFSGDGFMAVLTQHMTATPPPLPDGIDRPVSDLVMRLLAKEPADRPQSATELLAEFERLTPRPIALAAATTHPSLNLERGKALLLAAAYKARVGAGVAKMRARELYRYLAPRVSSLWRKATARFPQLHVFSRRVQLSRYEVRLGAIAGGAAGLGISTVLMIAAFAGDDGRAEGDPAAGGTLTAEILEASDVVSNTPEEPVPEVDDTLFEDLLGTAVYKRSPQDWIVLGAGHAQRNQWSKSVAAYRNAVQSDKKYRDDKRVLRAIRRAAQELSAYDSALNVAVNMLGDGGMDVVYDLWMALRDDPKKRLIAETAYKKLEILHLRRGSKALRVRLGLEFVGTEHCSKVLKLVEQAMTDADERSVEALEALEKTDGCAASKTRDCYPCLRDREADLEVALETANERAAPEFDLDD